MMEHSKAKVELYERYLSIYLNILHRSFINKIFIYDLFAGEGIYENNGKGSPIVAVNTIKDHYFSNNKKCTDIKLFFNDSGLSDIEPNIYKIDRIRIECDKTFQPENLEIEYHKKDFMTIKDVVLKEVNTLTESERALVLIDPYGYKDIDPDFIRELLFKGQTEIILFVPINFMYRFVDKSLKDDDYSAGIPLRKLLIRLFENNQPDLSSELKFIESMKNKLKDFTAANYVDTFTIERGKNRFFCLFFFTNHKKGFEKMLESKWKLDESNGRGFKIQGKSYDLFGGGVILDYEEKLIDFIKSHNPTNMELFDFGLENGYLPKHTNQLLSKYKESIHKVGLDVESMRGNYIGNISKNVQFIWRK